MKMDEHSELRAELDRLKLELANYKASLSELAKSMTAKISVLERDWYPKEDELIRWREFGEFVADYCQRMNFEVTGETRGDQIFSTVTDLLKESS